MHSKSFVEAKKRDSGVSPTIFNLTDHISEIPAPVKPRESLKSSGTNVKQKPRSTSPTIFTITGGEFTSNKEKPQPKTVSNARPKTAEAKRDSSKQIPPTTDSKPVHNNNKSRIIETKNTLNLSTSNNNFQKSLGSSGSVSLSPQSKVQLSSSGKKSPSLKEKVAFAGSEKVTNATDKARKRKEVEILISSNKTGNPNFDVFLEVMQKKMLQLTEEKMAAEEQVLALQNKLQKKDKDLRKEIKEKQVLIRENEESTKEIALLREEHSNLQKEMNNMSYTVKKKSQKEKDDLVKTIAKLQAELEEIKKIKLETSQQQTSQTPPNELEYDHNSEQSSPMFEQRLKEAEKENEKLLEEKLCLTKALSCALQEVHKQRSSEKSC